MFYYKQVNAGQIVSVEAKTHPATSPGFVPATQAEYDSFLASLPPPPPPNPPRDLEAEMDALEARVHRIEAFLGQ